MKNIVKIYEIKLFEINLLLFKIQYWKPERTGQITQQEDSIFLDKNVFDSNNQEWKSWSCLRQTCFSYLVVFSSQLFVGSLVAFEQFIFQKLVTSHLVGWESCVVQLSTNCQNQDYENNFLSTKKTVFMSLVGPSEAGKSQIFYNWLKIGTFKTNFDQTNFFNQHLQPHSNAMQKKIDFLEFVQGEVLNLGNRQKTTVLITW